MSVEYLDNGNSDGTVFGQTSSDKIAFFGATPVVQQTTTGACATTAATTTTPYGFATALQANTISQLVYDMHAVLQTLGLIA